MAQKGFFVMGWQGTSSWGGLVHCNVTLWRTGNRKNESAKQLKHKCQAAFILNLPFRLILKIFCIILKLLLESFDFFLPFFFRHILPHTNQINWRTIHFPVNPLTKKSDCPPIGLPPLGDVIGCALQASEQSSKQTL